MSVATLLTRLNWRENPGCQAGILGAFALIVCASVALSTKLTAASIEKTIQRLVERGLATWSLERLLA